MVGPISKPSIRSLGVLLHPTALPSDSVCGTFGNPSRNWLRLLALNGIGVWQFLPLSPPDPTGSPYSSPSSFALNPWFLDVQDLVDDGYISSSVISKLPGSNKGQEPVLDFGLADSRSQKLGEYLRNEWEFQSLKRHKAFEVWSKKQPWLQDHVFFYGVT